MALRKVPKGNYMILGGVAILVICACFAFYNVYNIIQDAKISKSPLATKEVKLEDLNETSKDIGADQFLFISYTQNETVYGNEKGIKKILSKYNLLDNVMYLDVTDFIDDEKTIDKINEDLKLGDTLKVEKVPAIIYYKDGVATKTIDSKDHILHPGDIQQIIDIYELAS